MRDFNHKSSWLMRGGGNCRYIWNTFSKSGINSHAVYYVGCSRKQAACRNNNSKAYIGTDNCGIQCCLSAMHLLGIYYTCMCFIQPAFVLVFLGNLNSKSITDTVKTFYILNGYRIRTQVLVSRWIIKLTFIQNILPTFRYTTGFVEGISPPLHVETCCTV